MEIVRKAGRRGDSERDRVYFGLRTLNQMKKKGEGLGEVTEPMG
jgi:hypothetical protein